MPSVGDGVLGFALALVIALLTTPVMGALAWRVGAIDEPRERGLHQFPTPRLGGLAILVAVAVGALVLLPGHHKIHGILIGAAVIAFVGAADDLLELGADFKIAGQVLAAAIPVAFGVKVTNFTLPFIHRVDLSEPLAYTLTILGLVALMNVVNFIDGVDGLAAGVCTIAAITFAVIALSLDRTAAGVLAMITAGAALGYLRHGFHPATIFLGDSGSNLLGYLLGAVAVQGALKTNAVVALLFPLVILAVPILDSSFVLAKRIKYGKPVYKADNWHFHHRFANIGFSQRRTVLYLYGWTLSLALLALALRFVPYSDDHGHFHTGWTAVMIGFGVIAVAASVYLVVVLEILKFRRLREAQLRRQAATGDIPVLSEHEIEAEIAREVETGEFEAVDRR